MAYITETWLREKFSLSEGIEIQLPTDSSLTPSARELLETRNIRVKYRDQSGRVFCEEKTPSGQFALKQVHPLTGQEKTKKTQCALCLQDVAQKPDTLTHLNATDLVPKNDKRLKLRGKLDSLIAYTVLIQTEFDEKKFGALAHYLADIRSLLGQILHAEVTGEKAPVIRMGELDENMLHAISHNPLQYLGHDHFLPEVSQGKTVAQLNILRAMIREAELCAADIYIDKDFTLIRSDLMKALNRLSSAVYVMMLLVFIVQRKANGIIHD